MNKYKQFFIIGIATLAFVFYFGFNKDTPIARGGASDNISGYAWGADDSAGNPSGMGWLSFNCSNDNSCGTADYGVNIDASGNMTGYAWSSNYGWVKFGGLSNFPTGPGTQSQNANLNGNNLKGWARFCGALISSDTNCTGNTLDAQSGGWDGWISLSGSGYGVTVNQSSGYFSGYAWGGSDVVGWINFSKVLKGVGSGSGLVLSSENNFVYKINDFKTNLSWDSKNGIDTYRGCVASNIQSSGSPAASWTGVVSNSPNVKQVDVPSNSGTYSLSCINNTTGLSENSNDVSLVRFSDAETVSLSSNGVSANKTTLTWTTTNVVPNSCVASGGWNGNKATTLQSDTGSQANVNVPNTAPAFTTYTITCTGFYSSDNVVASVDLNENSKATTSKIKPIYIER